MSVFEEIPDKKFQRIIKILKEIKEKKILNTHSQSLMK